MLSKITLFVALVGLLACPLAFGADLHPRIFPYAPMNAVAATTPPPYFDYLERICAPSVMGYPPCPSCGPASALLPDLPPACERIIGRFGRPVRVP
jgi:hypothetical protein